MAAAVPAWKIADNVIDGQDSNSYAHGSTNTFNIVRDDKAPNDQSSSSSYVLADDRSQFSRDIEHWMNGSQLPTPTNASPANTESTAMQGNRPPLIQRSVPARSFTLENTGVWYILAMVLPLFSLNSPHWRCTPSLILNSAELMMTHLSRVCGRVRQSLRTLSQDQMTREVFATAMDVVLVIYAVGFLVLSMYQASIFV